MTLTAISLFAGVGGFDLAAHYTGIAPVAAVEIDDKARGVLAHKFPQTHLFDDVRTVTGGQLLAAGFIPERGIIFGGFPCQDLSVAGKRAGLAGERSGLFYEIVRLLEELTPKYFVLENVPGLLSSNRGRDMGAVIGALVDCGYGVAYRVLDAQFFGVPQRRRRVFIVGCFGDDGRTPAQILAIGESGGGDSSQGEPQRKDSAGAVTDSVGDSGFTAASHGGYAEGIGTLRANGGDLGGGQRDTIGALYARDYKGVSSQYVDEGKVIVGGGESSDRLDTAPTVMESKPSTNPCTNDQKTRWSSVSDQTGTLSPGAHPGGFNGQDAYAGLLVVGEEPPRPE